MATPEVTGPSGSSLPESVSIDRDSLDSIIESAVRRALTSINNDKNLGDGAHSGKLYSRLVLPVALLFPPPKMGVNY